MAFRECNIWVCELLYPKIVQPLRFSDELPLIGHNYILVREGISVCVCFSWWQPIGLSAPLKDILAEKGFTVCHYLGLNCLEPKKNQFRVVLLPWYVVIWIISWFKFFQTICIFSFPSFRLWKWMKIENKNQTGFKNWDQKKKEEI